MTLGLLIETFVSEAYLSERLGGVVLVHDAILKIQNLELIWDDCWI